MSFSTCSHEQAQLAEFASYLASQITHLPGQNSLLKSAMEYVLLAPGKRVRPLLTLQLGNLVKLPLAKLLPMMAAVEMVHAYSLVHDDLPAMDDDDLRRGRATCHKQYDEATAILCGDALQTQAFIELTQSPTLSDQEKVHCIAILAQAAGYAGMCGGQALDLSSTGKTISLPELRQLHQLKTGALLKACVAMPLSCVSLPNEVNDHLLSFAEKVGLAYQVQDDILDIESSTEDLGKPSGSDIDANKSTFPAILGMQATKAYLQQLHAQIIEHLDAIDELASEIDINSTEALRQLAAQLLIRKK